jgi:hypothetical protein
MKEVGDYVERDEEIATIETDKVYFGLYGLALCRNSSHLHALD